MFHIIVSPLVSRQLRQLVASRNELLRILNRLHHQLTNRAAEHRRRRDPHDPDLFDYVHPLYTGGRWRTFRFSVNDTQATGYLFVEAVSATP